MPLPFIFPMVQQESSKIFPTLQMKLTYHYKKNESKFISGGPWLCLCLLKFMSFHLKNKSLESLTEYKNLSTKALGNKWSPRVNAYL